MRGSCLALPFLALTLGCGGTTEPAGRLEPGVWGGDRVNLVVSPDSARAEFDCASGRLDAPVALDPLGRFEVGGTYRFEAGPMGVPVPARWHGTLTRTDAGSDVTLTVTVLAPHADPLTLGPFHLKSGVRVTVGVCA